MSSYLNLKELIGNEFDENDIICCFQDTENEIIVSKVVGFTTNIYDEGECYVYNVYENTAKAPLYIVFVNHKNKIVGIG